MESALPPSPRRAAIAAGILFVVLFASCQRDSFVTPSATPSPFLDPAKLPPGDITTYAGTGHLGFTTAVPRSDIMFYYPIALAVRSADGALGIADLNNNRVCQVDVVSGMVRTVTPAPTGGFFGAVPPLLLGHPTGLVYDTNGTLLIASSTTRSILVPGAPDMPGGLVGDLWRRCGGGTGDSLNVLAVQGRLSYPADVAWGPDSTLYIADQGTSGIDCIPPDSLMRDSLTGTLTRVRRADGSTMRALPLSRYVVRFAGSGGAGFNGDDPVPAAMAQFFSSRGGGRVPSARLCVSPDGHWLYVCDSWNNRVRRVDLFSPDRTVTTFAGGGSPVTTPPAMQPTDGGFGGDGGPAVTCKLSNPTDVDVDFDGSVYICDSGNSRIRHVSPNGVIETMVGTGARGFAGDGGAAVHALLNRPFGISLDRQRRLLYIADSENQRVRVVKLR